MKYMISNNIEDIEFANDFKDALEAVLNMANSAAINGREDVVLLTDIDKDKLILKLYTGGGEVCTFFYASRYHNEYFPECDFDDNHAPVSYLYDRCKMNRKFREKYYAMKDGKVVVVTSDVYDLESELKDGHIPLPVSVMHISEDGTVENYEIKDFD